MSDNLTRADYLDHLGIDENHLTYVRTGDQVVRIQTIAQMDKWNWDGKIAINREEFRHPECGKIINRRIARRMTQNDHLDAPPVLENVPPINHENRWVETEQTKVKLTCEDRTEQSVVNLSEKELYINGRRITDQDIQYIEHGMLKKKEHDRRITDQDIQNIEHGMLKKKEHGRRITEQDIQDIEHGMLKKTEDLLVKKHYLKKPNEERIEKDQHLNNLNEEQEKIEIAFGEADNINGLLEDLIQANKYGLLRKQAQQNQTLMQFCEAEKGDWNDASSEQGRDERHGADNSGTETPSYSGPTMGGERHGADNSGTETPSSSGPTMGGERHDADNSGTETPSSSGPTVVGINNTQIIIKGNMNGTINYTEQPGMMQFIYLAIIVALFGYILLVD